MRLHIRVDARNEQHVHFSVFMNGAYCGRLTMTVEEFGTFRAMLAAGSTSVRGKPRVQFTEAPDEETQC